VLTNVKAVTAVWIASAGFRAARPFHGRPASTISAQHNLVANRRDKQP
jgi:hypothetical protein